MPNPPTNLQSVRLGKQIIISEDIRTGMTIPITGCLSLTATAPHVLQQTISLCQSVQGIIALAHRPYEAAKCIDLVLAGVSAVLIDLSN